MIDLDTEVTAVPNPNPLSVEDIVEIKEAVFHASLKKTKIVDRAYYIYKCIAKHFNVKTSNHSTYHTSNLEYIDSGDFSYGKDAKGDFDDYILKDLIRAIGKTNLIALINGLEYNFGGGDFPMRWLFTDFESELVDGINQYKKRVSEQKKIKSKRTKYKSSIISRLKKNMTPEEVEIVFGKDQS